MCPLPPLSGDWRSGAPEEHLFGGGQCQVLQTAQDDPELPPSVALSRRVSATPAQGSRLGDEITVGGIKYSDSLQADELLFKQASPSSQRRRPHQPETLGTGAWEMWGAPRWDMFLHLRTSRVRGCLAAGAGGAGHTDRSAALTELTFEEGAMQ